LLFKSIVGVSKVCIVYESVIGSSGCHGVDRRVHDYTHSLLAD